MTKLLEIQLYLFGEMMTLLEKQETSLNNDYNTARNLGFSSWKSSLCPHRMGGVTRLMPVEFNPENMDLLDDNYKRIRKEIFQHKCVLVNTFKDTLKSAGRWGEYKEYYQDSSGIAIDIL